MAPFFALKYAPPAMAKLSLSKGSYPNSAIKDQPYGSIIVVASVASTSGSFGLGLTMSSHAALGVVRAGCAELKDTGVRINCISPGKLDLGVDLAKQTKGNAKGGGSKAGTPKEVARVAGFLASGFSSFVTGQNIVVDGGASQMNPMMG